MTLRLRNAISQEVDAVKVSTDVKISEVVVDNYLEERFFICHFREDTTD
jgi:hypothetical protein